MREVLKRILAEGYGKGLEWWAEQTERAIDAEVAEARAALEELIKAHAAETGGA